MEFVAALYNILLRRDQVRAVELGLRGRRLSAAEASAISELSAGDLIAVALASGDVNSVKQMLQKKGLP